MLKVKKYITVYLLFNVIFLSSYAQPIDSPEINYVSVDGNTRKPEISWQYFNPSLIDGFSIIRLIYSHPLAAPMTYQTIYSVSDPDANFYQDISESFGPARPYERIEKYKILAFNINGTDTIYSIPTDIHQTIFLQTSYNYCEKTIKLIWNKYIGWNDNFVSYDIYRKSYSDEFIKIGSNFNIQDTVFFDESVISQSDYQYFIKATHLNGYESNSNESSIFTVSPDFPEYLTVDSLIVESENKSKLFFKVDNQSDIESFSLYKSENQSSDFYLISEFFTESQFIELSDPNFENSTLNSYFLQADDYCGNLMRVSDTVSTIFLEVSQSENQNILLWYSLDTFQRYSIFRVIDKREEYITETCNTSFHDNVSGIFESQFEGNITSGKFCYFVEGYKNTLKSISNIECINHEQVFYFPNAFNPQSEIEENRTFKPKIAYITDFQIIIYDKYGSKIFESYNPLIGWNGNLPNGKLAPAASYIYYTSFKNANGIVIKFKGFLSLVY